MPITSTHRFPHSVVSQAIRCQNHCKIDNHKRPAPTHLETNAKNVKITPSLVIGPLIRSRSDFHIRPDSNRLTELSILLPKKVGQSQYENPLTDSLAVQNGIFEGIGVVRLATARLLETCFFVKGTRCGVRLPDL